MSSEIYYSLAIYDGNGQSSMLSWWFLENPLKVVIFQFSMDFMAIPSHFPIEQWGFSKNLWYQDVDINLSMVIYHYVHYWPSRSSSFPLPPGRREVPKNCCRSSALAPPSPCGKVRWVAGGGDPWGPQKKRWKNEGKVSMLTYFC